MNTSRDSYIRLEIRKQNWLRLEFYRRFIAHRLILKRSCLRALRRDASLSLKQGIAVSVALVHLPKQSRVTKVTTRCRVTGRSRQAFRNIQLARMEFRRAMREGLLTGLKLGRM